ncbi:MAG: hypothetical protein V1792_16395 [Pseudomonadota bacterium]
MMRQAQAGAAAMRVPVAVGSAVSPMSIAQEARGRSGKRACLVKRL